MTSAFGSYRGEQVIPPFFTDYDVLKFEGDRASLVRDVRVEIRDLDQIDYPEIEEAVSYAALRRRARRSARTRRSTRSS